MGIKEHPYLASFVALSSIATGAWLAYEDGVDAKTAIHAAFIMVSLVAAALVIATVYRYLRESSRSEKR